MIQLKVFYNISFNEDRCEIISADEAELLSFEDLMKTVRKKVECLEFIPDEELRIKYKDDENTFINLRSGDSLCDAIRCACLVQGATFRRLTMKITWQPNTTPELIAKRRDSLKTPCEISAVNNSGKSRNYQSKKQLLYNPTSTSISSESLP